MTKPKPENKQIIYCLRCGRTSKVDLIAKCGQCGSFAVRLVVKNK